MWDRQRDQTLDSFLKNIEGEARQRLQGRKLDPGSNPNFEKDIGMVLNLLNQHLRANFRNANESGEEAEKRFNEEFAGRRGEPVLLGEFLEKKILFCRHLTLLTQAFLADLGLEGVRMQRGDYSGDYQNETTPGRVE